MLVLVYLVYTGKSIDSLLNLLNKEACVKKKKKKHLFLLWDSVLKVYYFCIINKSFFKCSVKQYL